ncbi:hypothetical protein ACOMHN_050363 [Nucella lapillus]
MEKEMNKKGWRLTPEGQEQCTENGEKSMTADMVIKKALNLDLRAIGQKWLPTDISTGRITADFLEGPAVLQIQKLRNVSAPKDNEESQAAPRLWKITTTDGHATVAAVCLQPLKNLSLVTPPGTKLLLEGKVDIVNGYLLLSNHNARLLGGHVPNLVESWQLKRKLAQQSRVGIQSEGGPPPFMPFGKKVSASKVEVPRRDDFKSLAAGSQAEEEENSEFQQQRQATIAEAEALTTGKPKTFGGGQKSVKDSDLARIVEMGFTADQASYALRQSGGNVPEAIGKLLGGGVDSRGEDFGHGWSRGGGGGGREGGGGRGGGFRGRGDRGEQRGDEEERGGRRASLLCVYIRRPERQARQRGEEEEEEGGSTRPSGPSTLFDFLQTKIPAKSEKQSSNKQRPYLGQEPNFSASQQKDQKPYTLSGNGYSSPRPSSPYLGKGEDWGKPSYHRKEAKPPQGGASQTFDGDIRSSDGDQRNAQSNRQKRPETAPSNNRAKHFSNDNFSRRNEDHPKQAQEFSQPNDRFDRSGRSKSQKSSQPERGDQKGSQPNDRFDRSGRSGSQQSSQPERGDQKGSQPNDRFDRSGRSGSQQSSQPERGDQKGSQPNDRFDRSGRSGSQQSSQPERGDQKGSQPNDRFDRSGRSGSQQSSQPERGDQKGSQPNDRFDRSGRSGSQQSSQPERGDQKGSQPNDRFDRSGRSGSQQSSQPERGDQKGSQPNDRFDRSGRSGSQQSSQPERGDRQKSRLNTDTRQNGGDIDQPPGCDQGGSRPFREQNSDASGGGSGAHRDRPHSQTGTTRVDGPTAGHRPQADSRQKGPPQHQWRSGMVVLAKYWEDKQLYHAVVEAVAGNRHTAVVTFLDYGNQEEVLWADIHPMPPNTNQHGYGSAAHSQGYFPDSRHTGMSTSYPRASDGGFDSHSVPKMEFRRGGSGQTHGQQGQENGRRPTQNYYTPPNYKK